MSAQLCRRSISTPSNQFIRPTPKIVMIDTISATRRLALRGSDFRASEEVAAAVAGGVAAELVDALMVALGSRFESLSGKDVTAILELYEAAPSAAMTAEAVKVHKVPDSVAEQEGSSPRSPNEAGGDEAAGSLSASINAVPEEKDALSSPEDDSSNDGSQEGDGRPIPCELPVDVSPPTVAYPWPTARKKGGSSRRLRHLA
jgi:hypothetical protein